MFKLNIIRKALNLGQDLYFIKDPKNSHIYFPYNPFVTKYSDYYDKDIILNTMEIIGKIKSEEEYYVLGGGVSSGIGLGRLRNKGIGGTDVNTALFGCTSKEKARHFSKYFGMLITEAKYGDLPDFQIVESKY